MHVYFSHGKESGPWGSKITRLADVAKNHNYRVESIDYTKIQSPDDRVQLLADTLENEEDEIILVGSSMGGYVSLAAAANIYVKGIFLLAPALYIPGYEVDRFELKCNHTEIVHGWSDVVIPPENSIRFAREKNCQLHLIDGDHRLASSLDTVERIFRNFMATIY